MQKNGQPFKVNTSKLNETSKNRSIVDCTGEQTLQLSMTEVNFVNTEPNEIYQISLYIRNVSQFSQKIKFKKPNCPAITVTASREGSLAAGLDMKLTVVFDSKENQKIRDRIVIATQNTEMQIPVNVYPNIGKLEFEPFINFGFVKVGTIAEAAWNITNKGDSPVKIRLIPLIIDQSAKLRLSNEQLTIDVGQKKTINLTLSSKIPGTVEGSIEIEPKSITYSTLEFVANFCEFARMLSNAQGKQIKQILIDPLFAGEVIQTSAFLVNNSPEGCQFRVTRKKGGAGDDSVSLITPEQIGKDDSQRLVQFKPSQGELQAYTSAQINTTVLAKYEEADQQTFCNYIMGKNVTGDFERDWTYTIRTHLNFDEQHLDLSIKGSSLVPKISLTPTYLEFPTTSLQQKQKKPIKIQNFSTKAVNIEFENSPNYSFHPQKLKIPPKGSMKVEVLFCPKKVGELNEICCLTLGVFSFPIKLFGNCSFAVKGEHQNNICEEIPISQLDRSNIQEEISAIQKGKATSILGMTDQSKNSIHFDSYRQATCNIIQADQKTLHADFHKRTRLLRNKNGKQQKFDVTQLNANQPVDVYPSTAKNQQEQRLVSKELTSLELRNIAVGPVIIDVGTVLLRAVQKKYFHICNFNQKPISIRLETSHQYFGQTSEQRQILPAQSHGGFPIIFEPFSQGPFKYTLQYVLNGCHFFELMVTGTCVLPSLTLSRNEVKFNIGQQDAKFEKNELLKLDNPFDYDVGYEWAIPANSHFVIESSSGVVKAHTTAESNFIYNFQMGGEPGLKIEELVKLKIKYGKSVEVKCSALIPQSPCTCKAQQIQFKEVAIGRTCESKLHIKNLSKVPTIYRINIPKELENLLTVSHPNGALPAQEITELCFKFTSAKTIAIESSIQIAIRGSKNIDLPVKAKVILPQVRVQPEEIDFGNVPIEGNPGEKQVALINDSNIPVQLELRFHNDTFLANNLKLGQLCDNFMAIIEKKEVKAYKIVHLKVAPNCRTVFTLQFYPEVAEQYEFYLPLFIPGADPMDELQKLCKCRGVKNRLMAMSKQVAFGKIVIEQAEQIYSKSQVLEIFNPQEEPITWWIDESVAPFRLDKKNGRLQGYEKCQIKIFFSADSPGEYNKTLKFFIDQTDIDISKCYMKVDITASACFPTLYFDRPYVILPTVRCGEFSSTTFQIFNGGYENINLKHAVVQQFSNIDLQVKYLNGSNLGVTRKQIKVEVSFVSQKPVSFTVKLSFFDNSGRNFTINVSGTSDTHTYTILDQEKGPLAVNLEKNCQFLKHYINATGNLSEELFEFPKSLMDNQYQKLAMLLANFSPAFEKSRSLSKKTNKNFFSFEYISQIIKILKAEGAFLNHIRPEMLLSYQQYLQNIKIRADHNNNIFSFYKNLQKNQFQLEQKQSWLILFYQIFKVFSRVNPGKLKSNAQYWVKFQARQKIIISWLEKTYLSQAGIELHSKGNELLSSMNNCEQLAALISKYTNLKILQCYGKNVKNNKQKEKRCKNVIDTFEQIGINCLFRLEDLLRSDEKQMLLVLENLYTILPSYLQKGEPIVFSCQFGQIVTKSVQITNPSKHQLTYLAKVEGSKAYSIDGQSQFIIDTKKTHQVRIKYISNMNMNNAQATLTLTGKANNKFTPSTFVFVLKSNSVGRISEKTIQVSGNIYQQLDFNIKVTNNFNEDGDFKVQLVPSKALTYNSFYLPVNNIKIKKGQTASLNMIFIPFMLESQQVHLIFRDEKVGEFQYQINGIVQNNILCQEVLRIPQVLFTNKRYTIDVPVPTKNDLMFRARKAAEYLADRLEKKTLTKDQKNGQTPINYYKYYPKLANLETFTAKLTTPNNSIILKSDQMIIRDIDSGQDLTKKEEQKLTFEINLKSAIKEGSFTVSLKNATGTDVRKYKVSLSAIAKPLRYELQMKTPANKPLSQPLPLINLSQQKNNFHVILVPSNDASRNVFSVDCEREVSVQPKEQSIINLSFKPKQQIIYNALLKVQNITSGQNVEYEIVGIGEEPDTERINFQQEVRKQKQYSIKLPVNKLTRCVVQSFDLENAHYHKNFQCTPEQPFFRFKLSPKLSGKLEGKLIIEADQTIFAYRIVINVKNTIEGQVKLRTVQRKEVSASLSLPEGQYRVICQDYNLKCPQSVTITPTNPNLQLTYYSSKPEQKEILLTMISDHFGEMTYIVKIIVQPMPEIKLEPFQVELGKMHKESVIFQNTDDVEMKVSCKCSHPTIFYPETSSFTVPARSKFNNYIIYKASSLEIQEGKLYFVSDRSAKWTYHLSGYGLPQNKPEIRKMTVFMGEHICEPISFRNPLNKTLQYVISLENVQGDDAFSMIMKSTKIDLNYNQQLEIPITMKPKSVALNKAILKIFVNQKINWKYELRAKTIYHSTEQPKTYKIQCRQKVQEALELPLPFANNYNGQTVKINMINAGDPADTSLIKNAIKIANSKEAVVLSEKVTYGLNILSFKPKNILTHFEVCASNGCKWIYKVRFNFIPPPVDDSFEIATGINKPASVKFRLTNRNKAHAKFHAYFSSQSCIDFTVHPKVGELEPYGREGTPIEVVFCPTQYRKSWSGKLIIETEESYWSYDVKGVLPHYNPPVGKSSLKQ